MARRDFTSMWIMLLNRVLKPIKKMITSIFRLLGLNITRIDKLEWLQNMNIRTILDIGANTGQWAKEFHELLPDAFIYSFEPLHDCFLEMNSNIKNVKNFKAFNVALGDTQGKTIIYRSEFSPASSLLRMSKLHKNIFPFTSGQTTEVIEVKRLDNVVSKLNLEDNILLKLDVQGLEDKVLIGGKNTLERAKLVIIETSFHQLYEGQPLFHDIYSLLRSSGFVYQGSLQQIKNPISGESVQEDSIFVKE